MDYGAHDSFRTEWWYFTGNLTAPDGRALGYQLTFFRSALTDSATYGRAADADGWRTRQAWMAHFAVSSERGAQFHATERFSRQAIGLAGVTPAPFAVWLDDWSARSEGTEMFPLHVKAADGDVAIDLVLERGKPIVLQGERGLSVKGPGPGNASYYYSLTRMPTTGTIRIGTETYAVTGASWLDREWSTSALSAGVAGWDWMALRFDDNTELMLYRLRRADGSADPFSAGTFVGASGSSRALASTDFEMTPLSQWSAPSGTRYPSRWRVSIPSLGMDIDVKPVFDAQELALSVRYWEGMVRVTGRRGRAVVTGNGYLEMTGYAQANANAQRAPR
jgi:predicted secreted hydrolase